MVSFINGLYTMPSARVLTNGLLSNLFQITNGTRQGCPLSPLIFAMVMEPFAEAIRTHPGISGVEITNVQHKINLFADDVILTLTDVEQSLIHTSEVLQSFSAVSYYKVNASKSLILDIPLNLKVKHIFQSHSLTSGGLPQFLI